MDADLKKRFGALVAAHRKKRNMTQQELADATSPSLSTNMIGRIETGKTGVSFATIVNLAQALGVDPAEFFTADIPKGALQNPKLSQLSARLAKLSEDDFEWILRLIAVGLERK